MKKIISMLFCYHFSLFAFAEISVITQVGDTLSSGDVIKSLFPVSSAAVGEQGHVVLGASVDRIDGVATKTLTTLLFYNGQTLAQVVSEGDLVQNLPITTFAVDAFGSTMVTLHTGIDVFAFLANTVDTNQIAGTTLMAYDARIARLSHLAAVDQVISGSDAIAAMSAFSRPDNNSRVAILGSLVNAAPDQAVLFTGDPLALSASSASLAPAAAPLVNAGKQIITCGSDGAGGVQQVSFFDDIGDTSPMHVVLGANLTLPGSAIVTPIALACPRQLTVTGRSVLPIRTTGTSGFDRLLMIGGKTITHVLQTSDPDSVALKIIAFETADVDDDGNVVFRAQVQDGANNYAGIYKLINGVTPQIKKILRTGDTANTPPYDSIAWQAGTPSGHVFFKARSGGQDAVYFGNESSFVSILNNETVHELAVIGQAPVAFTRDAQMLVSVAQAATVSVYPGNMHMVLGGSAAMPALWSNVVNWNLQMLPTARQRVQVAPPQGDYVRASGADLITVKELKIGDGVRAVTLNMLNATTRVTESVSIANRGELDLADATVSAGNLTVEAGGLLSGQAQINAGVVIKGSLAPGKTYGKLMLGGDLVFEPGARLDMDYGANSRAVNGESDRISVRGSAHLAGALHTAIQDTNNLVNSGMGFLLLDAGQIVGQFDSVALPAASSADRKARLVYGYYDGKDVVNLVIGPNRKPVALNKTLQIKASLELQDVLPAEDPDRDRLVFTVTKPPAGGDFQFDNRTGRFTYKHNNNKITLTSIEFTVADAESASSTGKFTIVVGDIGIPNSSGTGSPSDIDAVRGKGGGALEWELGLLLWFAGRNARRRARTLVS